MYIEALKKHKSRLAGGCCGRYSDIVTISENMSMKNKYAVLLVSTTIMPRKNIMSAIHYFTSRSFNLWINLEEQISINNCDNVKNVSQRSAIEVRNN